MPGSVRNPQTLYDKVLSKHIVDEKLDGTLLLYIGTLLYNDILENENGLCSQFFFRSPSRPRSDITCMRCPSLANPSTNDAEISRFAVDKDKILIMQLSSKPLRASKTLDEVSADLIALLPQPTM